MRAARSPTETPIEKAAAPMALAEARSAAAIPSEARQSNSEFSTAAVASMQRGAGNAGVARILARAPAAAPPGTISTADRARFESAKQRSERAKASKDIAVEAMTRYSKSAAPIMTGLRTDSDRYLEMHKAAALRVNLKLADAKETLQLQQEVLNMVLSAAFAGLGAESAKVLDEVEAFKEEVRKPLAAAKESMEEWKLGEIAGLAKKGVVGEPEASGAAAMDGTVKELEFLKTLTSLQGKSLEVIALGTTVGRLGEPIGRTDEAIAGVLNTGVARTDYPLAQLEKDAATLEMLTNGLVRAAAGVDRLLGELEATAALSKAGAPADDKELEKALWKHWAASLGEGTDFKLLDMDVLEAYLTRLGIWKELGIDIGSWFSSEEQILAVGSARAQEMVMGCRSPIEFQPGNAGFVKVEFPELPGSPKLRARLDPSSKFFTSKVRAVVINAEALTPEGSLDTELLKQTTRGKDGAFTKNAIAEYLLRNGYVGAVLRSYEDLSAPAADQDGAPPPP